MDCYNTSKHHEFYQMSNEGEVDSSRNHTGIFPQSDDHDQCLPNDACIKCKKCRKCSCTCHQVFLILQRLWTVNYLSDLLDAVKRIANEEEVPTSSVDCQTIPKDIISPVTTAPNQEELPTSTVGCQTKTFIECELPNDYQRHHFPCHQQICRANLIFQVHESA